MRVSDFSQDGIGQYGASFEYEFISGKNLNPAASGLNVENWGGWPDLSGFSRYGRGPYVTYMTNIDCFFKQLKQGACQVREFTFPCKS